MMGIFYANDSEKKCADGSMKNHIEKYKNDYKIKRYASDSDLVLDESLKKIQKTKKLVKGYVDALLKINDPEEKLNKLFPIVKNSRYRYLSKKFVWKISLEFLCGNKKLANWIYLFIRANINMDLSKLKNGKIINNNLSPNLNSVNLITTALTQISNNRSKIDNLNYFLMRFCSDSLLMGLRHQYFDQQYLHELFAPIASNTLICLSNHHSNPESNAINPNDIFSIPTNKKITPLVFIENVFSNNVECFDRV